MIILATVASIETSFSKLKLLNLYFISTMSQEKLNDLEIIVIETNMLGNIDCEKLMNNFTAKTAMRASRFL